MSSPPTNEPAPTPAATPADEIALALVDRPLVRALTSLALAAALACFVGVASYFATFDVVQPFPHSLRLPVGLSCGLLVGLSLARGLAPGRARVVASVAAGVAAGLVGASPALGDLWGPRPALGVEALAAVALAALIARRCSGPEQPSPPGAVDPLPLGALAPHQLVRRALLDALLAGVPVGLALAACLAPIAIFSGVLSWRLAVWAGVLLSLSGAVAIGLATFAQGRAALAKGARRRLALLAGWGLAGPLAIAAAVLWISEMVQGSGDYANAWVHMLDLGERALERFPRTIGWFVAFLAPFLLLGAARLRLIVLESTVPLTAALVTVGSCVTAAAVEQILRMNGALRLWTAWAALACPWVLALGLEAARRLDGWLVARWERRWAD